MKNFESGGLAGRIASLFEVTELENELMRQKISSAMFDRDSFLLTPGGHAQSLFFLQKGAVRSFYQQDGREINTEFFFENEFLTAFTSFFTGERTKLCFQCMEHCEITIIPREMVLSLLAKDNKWHILIGEILKDEYIKKCRRESSFLLHKAEERYFYFLEQFPKAQDRIPLFHTASYLGISPETLSRIRSKKISQIDVSQLDKI